jgi:hypothetical protein
MSSISYTGTNDCNLRATSLWQTNLDTKRATTATTPVYSLPNARASVGILLSKSRGSPSKLCTLFSRDQEHPEGGYYVVLVVGSGNGVCGFSSHYLNHADKDQHVLVLEQGRNFFYTSEITHQNVYTKSYSEGNIFKLHNARTPDGTPILSSRACAMGVGGSITYTMIHKSSAWFVKHLGPQQTILGQSQNKVDWTL